MPGPFAASPRLTTLTLRRRAVSQPFSDPLRHDDVAFLLVQLERLLQRSRRVVGPARELVEPGEIGKHAAAQAEVVSPLRALVRPASESLGLFAK